VEYSKKNPGKVNYGVVGPHGVGTVRYLLLQAATGIEWTEISYSGDAPTLTALMGGHIDTGSAAAAGIAAMAKAGKIRILAVPAAERSPNMPDVPTFREQGYNVVLPSYNVILGPRGIPTEALKPMVNAIERATATPEYKKFAEDSGADLFVRTGDAMRSVLNGEGNTYRNVAPLLKDYIKSHPVK
jgi:tripartite-type tricarboxylate transporter receptor subunit TctC